ncbi:MAG: hypothetical protein IPH09_01545 [bacterium]|nr:hypothetical protein [bacterium]
MNYWDLLAEARARLDEGDLRGAESRFTEAADGRERSPVRVFLSEKMSGAAKRALTRLRGAGAAEKGEAGRWDRERAEFVASYREQARGLLDRARASVATPGTFPPRERLHLAAGAAYLTATSELADLRRIDPSPFLEAALAAACEAGSPPPPGLLAVSLPLAADVRLRLAARVLEFARRQPRADDAVRELAADADALLAPEHMVGAAQESERLWLAAQLAEGPLDDASRAGTLYAACSRLEGTPADRRDLARLAAAALLANLDRFAAPVPRYDEARGLLEAPADDPVVERRRRAALAILQERRVGAGDGVWASAARNGEDGRGYLVVWRRNRPVDVLCWDDGASVAEAAAFLGEARERILVLGEIGDAFHGWELRDLVEALLEPELPARGLDDGVLDTLAVPRGETAAPHPLLGDERREPVPAAVAAALRTGRTWLGAAARLAAAEPGQRAMIRELARRGDAAARLVAAFLPPELVRSEGWPLAPLQDRPSPRVFAAAAEAGGRTAAPRDPELAATDSALVFAAERAPVLEAWGQRRAAWRIVLDGADRLADLAGPLARQPGAWTLVPPGGAVHDRDAALSRLSEMACAPGLGLLPLMHACRIAVNHNGDLADHRLLRPRAPGACPLLDRYDAWLEQLPRCDAAAAPSGWAAELAGRVDGDAPVVGLVGDLPTDARARARLWGLGGRSGAWVFTDAAVINWRWHRAGADEPALRHRALAESGAGQLSLLAPEPVLDRDLAAVLGGWLAAHGRCRVFARGGAAAAPLMLAVGGPPPDARVRLGAAAVAHARRLAQLDGSAGARLLVPRRGPLGTCLLALARGEIAAQPTVGPAIELPPDFWEDPDTARRCAGGVLYVPQLESLDPAAPLGADDDSWRRRDDGAAAGADLRRTLMALELHALRARSAGTVMVGDTRWWRSFPLGATEAPLLDAAGAADLAGAWDAGVFDLDSDPVRAPARRGRTADPLRAAVLGWLQVQGWTDAQGRGLPAGFLDRERLALPADWPQARRRLVLGDPAAAWLHSASALAAAREDGDHGAWLLVVSDAPPPEAAVLRDALTSPRPSLLAGPSTRPDEGWHAVVWARPADLADPELVQRLARRPPTEIWAGDLGEWLPTRATDGGRFAPCLHALLHLIDAPMTLQAADLPGSWRRHLAALFEQAGGLVHDTLDDASLSDLAVLPPVAIGRVPHPQGPCPGCGAVVAWQRWSQSCPDCGSSLERWASPADRAALLRRLWRDKLRALAERTAAPRPEPLCVWAAPEHVPLLTSLLDEAGRRWRLQPGRQIEVSPAPDEWLVCVLGRTEEPPAECRHALLDPPPGEQELRRFRLRARGETGLWFHPLELDTACGTLAGDERRENDGDFRRLLAAAATPPLAEAGPGGDGPLPSRCIETLTGLPAAEVRRALGVAAWSAAVGGRSLGREPSPRPRRVRAAVALVEAEYRLARLDALLPRVIAALGPATALEGSPLLTEPARLWPWLDPTERVWWDRLLLAISPQHAPAGGTLLVYAAAGGSLHSTRRRCGVRGDAATLAALVAGRLAAVRERAGALAVHERGADLLGDADDDVHAAGVMLGLWCIDGAPACGEIALADFAAVFAAGSDPAPAAALLAALAREDDVWREQLLVAWHDGHLPDVRPVAGRSGAREAAATTVADWPPPGSPPLVLEGMAGTGACEEAVRLLAALLGEGSDDRQILVIAPGTAAAARFHLAWRRLGPGLPPLNLALADDGLDLGDPPADGPQSVAPAHEVLVLLEAQDLTTALRFRAAQRYRAGRQLWTVDPLLCQETREHLYLEMPPRQQVIVLREQRDQSRQVCEEILDLAARVDGERPRVRAGRRERGAVVSSYTTNGPEAVNLIVEQQRGGAGRLWNLVAPLRSDFATLAPTAALAGWIPLERHRLDALLLPGPLEFLALAQDVAGRGDGVAARRGGAPDRTSAPDLAAAPAAAGLLPPRAAREYRQWLQETAAAPTTTLSALVALAARAGWSETWLAWPAARRRLKALIADHGGATLAELAGDPLLAAWRLEVDGIGDLRAPAGGPTILALTTPEDGVGGRPHDLACLCFGNEKPRELYRAIAPAGDRLLVCYKDRSPLGEDGG